MLKLLILIGNGKMLLTLYYTLFCNISYFQLKKCKMIMQYTTSNNKRTIIICFVHIIHEINYMQ